MRGEEVNKTPTRVIHEEVQRLVDPRTTGYELAEDPAKKHEVNDLREKNGDLSRTSETVGLTSVEES